MFYIYNTYILVNSYLSYPGRRRGLPLNNWNFLSNHPPLYSYHSSHRQRRVNPYYLPTHHQFIIFRFASASALVSLSSLAEELSRFSCSPSKSFCQSLSPQIPQIGANYQSPSPQSLKSSPKTIQISRSLNWPSRGVWQRQWYQRRHSMQRGQGQSFWISLNSWNSPFDLFFPLHPFIYSVYLDNIHVPDLSIFSFWTRSMFKLLKIFF